MTKLASLIALFRAPSTPEFYAFREDQLNRMGFDRKALVRLHMSALGAQ